jgi:hypothetical protein
MATATGPVGSIEDRIVAWALAGHTIDADEWYNGGPDGGPRCRSIRSRISDLERQGYGFHHIRQPDTRVVYRLAHVPPPAAPPKPSTADAVCELDHGEQLALAVVGTPAPTARPGLYDVEAA